MTREQIIEAEECIPLLERCREHLDRAMYGLGDIGNQDKEKLDRIYEFVCKALDEY